MITFRKIIRLDVKASVVAVWVGHSAPEARPEYAQWPGTHSRILSGIQRAAQTVLGVYLKRTCSRVTSASSALGVLNDYALYKSTHSLTQSRLGGGIYSVECPLVKTFCAAFVPQLCIDRHICTSIHNNSFL